MAVLCHELQMWAKEHREEFYGMVAFSSKDEQGYFSSTSFGLGIERLEGMAVFSIIQLSLNYPLSIYGVWGMAYRL